MLSHKTLLLLVPAFLALTSALPSAAPRSADFTLTPRGEDDPSLPYPNHGNLTSCPASAKPLHFALISSITLIPPPFLPLPLLRLPLPPATSENASKIVVFGSFPSHPTWPNNVSWRHKYLIGRPINIGPANDTTYFADKPRGSASESCKRIGRLDFKNHSNRVLTTIRVTLHKGVRYALSYHLNEAPAHIGMVGMMDVKKEGEEAEDGEEDEANENEALACEEEMREGNEEKEDAAEEKKEEASEKMKMMKHWTWAYNLKKKGTEGIVEFTAKRYQVVEFVLDAGRAAEDGGSTSLTGSMALFRLGD